MSPFFSIIIPTRGRANLIRYAILSTLRQTFEDFEIIIVDNNTDDETQKIVKGFTDKRIRYFQTGGLSMPDNWEFGLSKAEGNYITVLSDRLAYTTKFSLKKIFNAIKPNTEIVSWEWAMCDDTTFEIIGIHGNGGVKKISTEEIVNEFLNGNWYNVAYLFPKGLNSCISRALYQNLKEKWSRVCWNIAPDYTMAFLQILTQKELVHINECIFLSGGNEVSNGTNFRTDAEAQRKYIHDIGANAEDFYKLPPLKVITGRNTIFNDFFKISQLVKSPYRWEDVNMLEYLLVIYNEIMWLKQDDERNARIAKWNEVVEIQNAEIRSALETRIRNDRKSETPSRINETSNTIINKIISFFTYLFRQAPIPAEKKQFKNIIDAIEKYELNLNL